LSLWRKKGELQGERGVVVDLFAVVGAEARRQNGAIQRRQLIALGVSPAQIRTWVPRGQLHPIHQGVYAIAPPSLLPFVREAAALLALGRDAALGYRSAAALWGLADRGAEVDVVVVNRKPKPRSGIRIHRVKRLSDQDMTVRRGLRLTMPARTVIDFATDAALPEIERALNEGRALNLITDPKVAAALERLAATHRGAAKVRALLRRQVGRVITRSQRERTVLKLLEAAGLPKPLVNQPLHGYRPDFYWPEHRLILEFDGFRTHGSRTRFESDRKRDQVFAAKGIQTMRATWLQSENEPVALAVRIGQALSARGV
jgi:very-short-patch-repair endonuclease/predicted transcriptional regulator of viral defense system